MCLLGRERLYELRHQQILKAISSLSKFSYVYGIHPMEKKIAYDVREPGCHYVGPIRCLGASFNFFLNLNSNQNKINVYPEVR